MFKIQFEEEKDISYKIIRTYFDKTLSESENNYKYEDKHLAIVFEKESLMGRDVYMFIKVHFHHMRPEEFLNKIKNIFYYKAIYYLNLKQFEEMLEEHWNRAFSEGYQKHKEELRQLIL